MTTANRKLTSNSPDETLRFAFGKNWASYIEKNFSEERISISQGHLLEFMKMSDLQGRSFLDIGCGSGLHSLAAWRAGAEQVFSFDFDPESVATTRKLHAYCGSPENWTILGGSILDTEFVNSLPAFDIVYSWGVLHHTGRMWEAVANAATRIKPDGVMYIALYSSDIYISPSPEYWIDLKQRYNQSWAPRKLWMEVDYAWSSTLRAAYKRGINPLTFMRDYKKSRGMSFWHDVRDWLGGYPMEFAGNRETRIFCQDQLDLELIHTRAGEGNTEYLFRRTGARNYWDEMARQVPLVPLAGPFRHIDGNAWAAALPEPCIESPRRLMLYEDGNPIGWPQADKQQTILWGKGRYRIGGGTLIFSSTDNSDPNTNGRRYEYRADFA